MANQDTPDMQSQADLKVRFAVVAALAVFWALVAWDWSKFLFLQSDTFWLIETGRYILEHHALPAHDIYSFTRNGSEWVVYQWLFEVVLAGLFQIGGWLLVSLFGTLTIAWLFCIDMPRAALPGKANPLVVVAVATFALFASLPDIVALRPQLVTFVLLWLTFQILNRNWPAPGRTMWLLVPIMLVWVNVHISFVIQLVVLAAYTLAAAGARLRHRQSVMDNETLPLVRPFAVVLAACLVASLVNPYGVSIYDFIIDSWREQNITPELRPVDWTRSLPLLAYVVLACFSIAVSARRMRKAELLCAAVFLAAGLVGARFILYFVVWSVPVVCMALTRIGASVLEQGGALGSLRDKLQAAMLEPLYPVVVLLAVGLATAARPTVFPTTIPVKAADYLDKHRPAGPLFCGEHAGSYLIFRFHGDIPVFIDTRADVYGREFCEQFRQTMLTGRNWTKLSADFRILTALVPSRYQLAGVLEASSDWRVGYKDEHYIVFERSVPAN